MSCGFQEEGSRGLLERPRSVSSACRYQRFLEQELGQLLQSQVSLGQSGRHLSGQVIQNNRQPCQIGGLLSGQATQNNRQPCPLSGLVSGQAGELHEQLLQSALQRQGAAAPLQQADLSLANKQVSDPSLCVGGVLASRVSSSGLHSQQKSRSQRVSDSAYLAKWEYTCKGSQLDDRQPQLHARQHRGQSKSAEVMTRSTPKSQSEVQSAQSSNAVSQVHLQPCEIARTNGEHTDVKLIRVYHQEPDGTPEPPRHSVTGAMLGAHGLRGDSKGQAANSERHKVCNEGPRAGSKRMEEGVVQLRRALGHSRGCSPQRRQLLLHRRFSLFDSDSSSSEDEEAPQQVALSSHVFDLPLSVSHPSISSVASLSWPAVLAKD